MLTAIVAMSENRAIGKNNQLPWHLPADLKHFRDLTINKPILMGRKTFQSIGRPLPNRLNVVISRDENFKIEGCRIYHSINEALFHLKDYPEICLIGGAELFRQMLPNVRRIYLTIVHHTVSGDVFFPELNSSEWNEIERVNHAPDDKNPYSYSFITLERKS